MQITDRGSDESALAERARRDGLLRRLGLGRFGAVGKTGEMRPITAIVLAVLLVLILGAAALQLVLISR